MSSSASASSASVEVPLGVLVEVVLDHEAPVVVDAAHQLLELQAHEPAVDAELDDVALDLLGDAPHHLGALQHGDDVAQRDEVLDLEGRQRRSTPRRAGSCSARASAAPGWPG